MQTVNMTAVNQTTFVSFHINDQNGNAVPMSALQETVTISDPNILGCTVNSALGNQTKVTGKAAGSAQISYKFDAIPGSGYTGSVSFGPDTINIAQLAIDPNSATNGYSVPQ